MKKKKIQKNFNNNLTKKQKNVLDKAFDKAIKHYGEAIKKLGST